MSLRRWAVLLCGAVLAAAGLTAGTSAAAAAAPRIVHVCPQFVPAGRFTCYAERLVVPVTTAGTRAPQRAAATSQPGYGPSDLRSAYGLANVPAPSSGKWPRVYVIDAYDAPTAEADLKVYRARWQLPSCTTGNGCFQKLNQRGAAAPLPKRDPNWAGETALDLDMVSAVCPRCDITLIEADRDDNSLLAAVRTATSLGAKFVSMSWGGPEDGYERSYDDTYFRGANGKGAGVFYGAATGDVGYGASYPATSPRAVAVGGTSLKRSSTSARGWAETAWEDAGSGCSMDESRPAWQTSAVVSRSACAKRANSDVAAVADPATGVSVYNSYYDVGWAEYGGTSAAAPIIVAAAALAGVPKSSAVPDSAIYGNGGAGLHDVTYGPKPNGPCGAPVCAARAGWDGPTGLGTLNGVGALTPAVDASAHVVRVNYPGARSGRVGTPARVQVTGASYPSAALTYAALGLPPGVTMSRTGLLSGTPTHAGNYAPVVIATDGHGGRSSTSFRWPVTLVCSARLVSNGGFESGAKSWQASKGIVHKLARRAHRGSHFVRLDGRGHRHTDRLTRTFTMPLGCHATLSYYLKVTTKDRSSVGHDRMRLTVDGRTLQSRTNRSAGGRYKHVTLNLTRYNGKRITVSWIGRENRSRATSFYLDDISIKLSK